VEPSEAFAAIRERPSAWLPLLAIVLGTCLILLLYFNEVDIGWFFERQMEVAAERQQLHFENLRTQWERTRGLHDRNLIDEDSFVTATNNLEIADVDLRSSRESL
jgi:hypothetical protein